MSDLLPVEEAVRRVLAGVLPMPAESIALDAAFRRVLATPLAALRTQPPFDVSAMDGYAVRAVDLVAPRSRLTVIGSAPAGHRFAGTVGKDEAVRIFTGAPMPPGADAVLIQENVSVQNDGTITTTTSLKAGQFARPRGLDFAEGDTLIAPGTVLGMRDLALAAAMNHAVVPVRVRPRIAFIATGDELVRPGEPLRDDQIVASTGYGLAALVRSLGGEPIDHGIIPDDRAALGTTIDRVMAEGVDVLVTLGGASVGDHDIVGEVLAGRGMVLDFWKIAMRPGKPLMFGRIGATRVIGLPGNPVSSLVCAVLFLAPLLRALLGADQDDSVQTARLGAPLKANDRRQDYLRATLEEKSDGIRVATALPVQDSSMLSAFARANCLIIRPPYAEEALAGEQCEILRLP